MNRYRLHEPRLPIKEYRQEFYPGQKWKKVVNEDTIVGSSPDIITIDRLYLSEVWYIKDSPNWYTENYIKDYYEPI